VIGVTKKSYRFQINRFVIPVILNPKFDSFLIMKNLFAFAFCLIFVSSLFAQQSNGVGTTPTFRGPVGIQMYSLRDYVSVNAELGLKLAHDLGFEWIEPSGSFKSTYEEYRAYMEKYKLKAISKNFGYGDLTTDAGIDQMIEIGKILGVKYVGIAWLPEMSEEKVQEVIRVFNHAGERIHAAGLTFTFHNHGKEFTPWKEGKEGETLFDRIIQETNPENVKFEMDVRWVTVGDPIALLKKYPGRFVMMHVKCDSGKNGMLLEEGNIDWKTIFAAGQEAGIDAYFLEYDDVRNIVPNTIYNLRYLESLK